MNKFLQHFSTQIGLIFLFLVILIAGGILAYWIFIVTPVIRAGEQTKADLLIVPYAQLFEEALASNHMEKVEKIISQLMLLTDPSTHQPMVISMEVDLLTRNKIVRENKGLSALESRFTTEVPLFSRSTNELLGTVRLKYNAEFYNRLIADAKEKLFWGIVILLFFLIFIQRLLFYFLRPLSALTKQLREIDFSKLQSFSSLRGRGSIEIEHVYSAINDLLYRLAETSHREIGERQLRHDTELKYIQREAELQHMEFLQTSLREKELLLKEIHHRVKNNLQIIISLLKLQSDYVKDKDITDILKDSQDRIKTMSLVHEKLYQSKDLTNIDLNDYIKHLMIGLFRSYGVDPNKITFHINIEILPLEIDMAIPCGLIINELVSNSLKHAFPEDGKGEMKVILHKDHGETVLVVSDNGAGIPEHIDFRNTESLGLRLVTILAEDQLRGNISLNRAKGTEFCIKFKEKISRIQKGG